MSHRRTIARHAPLPTPGPLSSLLKFLGIGLAVLLVSAVGVSGFLLSGLAGQINDGAVNLEGAPEVAPPGLGAYPGEFAMMIVGTDECGPVSTKLLGKRCTDAEEGMRSDVNLMVHVSAEPRKVTVVSFPRDLMLEQPECTREDESVASFRSKTQINGIYERAGLSCIVKTITELTGVPIGFAAKISFDGVIEITEAVGGVEVCIGGDGIRDHHAGIDWPAGNRVVRGEDALKFLRTRKGVGDGSDLARVSNQQQYMSRLARKVLSAKTLSDPATVLRLADTFSRNIVPSESLTNPLTLTQLALALNDVPFSDFVFVQYPTYTDPDNKNRVVPNYSVAKELWAALSAGSSVALTGKASPNGGVDVVAPTTGPTPAPSASATPSDRVTLPPGITGQTVDQDTCSNGKQR